MQHRKWLARIVLLIAASGGSGLITRAQTSPGKPLILEVTWKAETSGRGAASIIRASYEVQERYQLVFCGGDSDPLPNLKGMDQGRFENLCIKLLDGHIVHAEGHGAGDDEVPAYAYRVPDKSSAGVPAPGRFLSTPDGKVEIVLRPGAGNPVIYGTNGSAEESLGCDGSWSHPRISYEQLQNLATLDIPWAHAAITDATLLETCNPGKISLHIRASGLTLKYGETPFDVAQLMYPCGQQIDPHVYVQLSNHERQEVDAGKATVDIGGWVPHSNFAGEVWMDGANKVQINPATPKCGTDPNPVTSDYLIFRMARSWQVDGNGRVVTEGQTDWVEDPKKPRVQDWIDNAAIKIGIPPPDKWTRQGVIDEFLVRVQGRPECGCIYVAFAMDIKKNAYRIKYSTPKRISADQWDQYLTATGPQFPYPFQGEEEWTYLEKNSRGEWQVKKK